MARKNSDVDTTKSKDRACYGLELSQQGFTLCLWNGSQKQLVAESDEIEVFLGCLSEMVSRASGVSVNFKVSEET